MTGDVPGLVHLCLVTFRFQLLVENSISQRLDACGTDSSRLMQVPYSTCRQWKTYHATACATHRNRYVLIQDSRKPYLPEAHLPVPTEFDCPCPLLRHYWKKLLATVSRPICADIANELFQRNDIALAELELILHADPQAQPQELMLILARRSQATVVRFARLLHQTPVNDIRRIGHSMLSEAGNTRTFDSIEAT